MERMMSALPAFRTTAYFMSRASRMQGWTTLAL